MLNLKHLYYYHVFARELSTTRAAKRLGITSPALSNQLKQLESCAGVPLTRRIGGKVVITEYGKMILNYADRMFSTYEELNTRILAAEEFKLSHFRAGMSQNLGARFTFDLLSLIEKSHLSLSQRVQITFDSSDRIFEGFSKGEFDVALGAFASEPSPASNQISHELAFPVRLFAPPSLLAKTTGAAPSDPAQLIELANARNISLVLPMQPSNLRVETDRFLSGLAVQPARTIETNRSGAIVQLIERGFAMGFVPTPSLLDFTSARDLTVLGPPDGYWSHGMSVFIRRGDDSIVKKRAHLNELFSSAPEFN
jgi:LysR family transcriptional activator of nhaA